MDSTESITDQIENRKTQLESTTSLLPQDKTSKISWNRNSNEQYEQTISFDTTSIYPPEQQQLIARNDLAANAQRQLEQSRRQLDLDSAYRITGGVPAEISEANLAANVFEKIELNRGASRALQALEVLNNSDSGRVLFEKMREMGVRVEVLPDNTTKLENGSDARYDQGAKRVYVRASALLNGGGHGERAEEILGEELLHAFIPGYSQREEYYAKYAATELARRGGINVTPNEQNVRDIVNSEYSDWARRIAYQGEDIPKLLKDKLNITVPNW